MTVESKRIFDEALMLPSDEKALLAEQLLSSLDLSCAGSIDEKWAQEAEKRIDAYERGEMKTISAKKVFEKIESKK